MPGKTDHVERRQFGRRHSHDRGWIKLPGRPSLPCVIRNISNGGAMLVFDRVELLPFAFLLTIEGDAGTYGCEIRHHFGDRAGVAFVDVAIIANAINTSNASDTGSWLGPDSMPRFN